jgi:hypothetical protein
MANKTRRRKKSAPGEPFSRARKQEAQQQAVMSKNRRAQIEAVIEQHLNRATDLMSESDDVRLTGNYGEAGRLLREASNYLHLANAEKSKLPPVTNEV